MSNGWSSPTSSSEVIRRAGGRRHYNSLRREAAIIRRGEVARAWMEIARQKGHDPFLRGVQSRLAERFGVSRSTICRDMKDILCWSQPMPCPTCETLLWGRHYERLVSLGKIHRRRDRRADIEAMEWYAQRPWTGERSRKELSGEAVLQLGMRTSRSRTLAMAQDGDVAVALVDERGDGTHLLVTCWRYQRGGWSQEAEEDVGDLPSPVTGVWEEGRMAYALGHSGTTRVALIRYAGDEQVCRPSDFGFWAFARHVEGVDRVTQPELVA